VTHHSPATLSPSPGPAPTTATPAKEAAPPMLADKVDHIIGVDTHKDSHTIAVVSPAA
jgi:hypothetical protein